MPSTRSFLYVSVALVVGSLVVASCGLMKGSSSDSGQNLPSWYMDNRPMDPHHIFAAATATAPRLQLASSKAASRARGDIAATIETRFDGLTKQFREEVGQGAGAEEAAQFAQAYQAVVSQTINGAEVVKREIRQEDGGYRAYVLMRMPIGKAQEKLLAQLQAQENTFSRFRSSEAFDELESEVDGYRRRRSEQRARRQRNGRQVSEQRAQDGPDQPMGEGPDDEQVQTQTGEVSEQQAESGAAPEMGEQPDAEQVRASDDADGDAPVSGVQAAKAKLRAAADPWLGTPYQLGGETKNGVDCSALVQALYDEAFNVDLPRTTGQQANRGTRIRQSNMRPGDLVFFRTADQQKHVGVYLDDQKFIHASSSSGVTISPMNYDYWQRNYWTSRRFDVI